MPRFAYTVIDSSSGRESRGVVESSDAGGAAVALKARGLFPTALIPEDSSGKLARSPARLAAAPAAKWKPRLTLGRAVSRTALAAFTRQLATLLKAGLPLMRGLEVLGRQERNPALKTVLASLAEAIRAGGNLSDGLLRHPKVFDRLYVNMVKAGEAGGALEAVLERLALFLEKAGRIRGRVKAALTYPLIIVLVAAVIVGSLMVFVIPKFQAIFAGLLKGAPLPALTQWVLGLSNFIKGHLLLTLGLLGLLWLALAWFRRTAEGARLLDGLLLKLPGLGPLFLKAAIARFSRTLGTLLASGVQILPALLITRDTSGNVRVAAALGTIHDRVKEGESVAGPLEAAGIFPGMVTSMIAVGEETGALPGMLGRVADTYDDEVDNAVAGLTSILEPVMIVFMALVVGVIVVALFLPIIRIVQLLG